MKDFSPDQIEAWLGMVRHWTVTQGVSAEEGCRAMHIPEGAVPIIVDRLAVESPKDYTAPKATVLSGSSEPKEWVAGWESAHGIFWPAQRDYLLKWGKRSALEVEALDDASDEVFHELEDPRAGGPETFRTQGLVIGHVQSGKTENFSALIAKAADLGYRVVIVLSGMHNSLRRQTQQRLERELGFGDTPGGVERPPDGQRWIEQTNADLADGDFSFHGSIGVLQSGNRIIFVVKKNAKRLQAVIDFIASSDVAHKLPALIVDDEADQASINTGDDFDPSKINAFVRQLIASFERVAYIAYTATPFANVLIDPGIEDKRLGPDLYPRDFIISLDKKPGYLGAEDLFGKEVTDGRPEEESERPNAVRDVPETDAASLKKDKNWTGSVMIPTTLRHAIADWIIATAVRSERHSRAGRGDFPSGFLIHTSHLTEVQRPLVDEVRSLLALWRREWRYHPESEFRDLLAERWNAEFKGAKDEAGSEISYEDIGSRIYELFRYKTSPAVLLINSGSDDELDYERSPYLKAIIVGGNRLSRGLTIEGLTGSYYVREARAYDSLMQMGRWFGYRPGYGDLTRVWTTTKLANWFRDLAVAEEDLRVQIKQFRRDGKTPEQVGPIIRSHPDLTVTAPSKMGAGTTMNISYAQTLRQAIYYPLGDREALRENLRVGVELIGPHAASFIPVRNGFVSGQFTSSEVTRFLASMVLPQSTGFDRDSILKYIVAQTYHGELVDWDVAVSSRVDGKRGAFTHLGISGLNAIFRTRRGSATSDSIGVLANPAHKSDKSDPGDIGFGLSDTEISEAYAAVEGGQFEQARDALLAARSPQRGLLILYPIAKESVPSRQYKGSKAERFSLFADPDDAVDVLGVAVAFPASASAAAVEYIRGAVDPDSGQAEEEGGSSYDE